MIIIKNKADLEGMRTSGRLVAHVRDSVAKMVAPGVSTADLADYGHELILKSGSTNAFLGYRGFPGKMCISVNDVVVHGIPDKTRIELGDVVSIDVGLIHDGFVGDTATSVMVGVTDPRIVSLVRTTEQALARGIDAARAGGRLSDISHAVQTTAEAGGFSVVRDFVGHGIGREMHEEPQIPNFGQPGRGPVLREGMTLAIEPMVNVGRASVHVEDDGWTVRTADGSASAHCEHTVAVHDGQAEILTLGENA
jgi:methionyl aminopeptidase